MAAGQASRGGGKAPAPAKTWRAKIPDAAEAPEEKPTAALDTLAPKPSSGSAPKTEPEEPKSKETEAKAPEAKSKEPKGKGKELKGKKGKSKSKEASAQEPKSREPKQAPAEPVANDDDDDDDHTAALQEAQGDESSSEWLFVERGNALGVHAAGKLSKPGANEALLQILEKTLKKRKAEKKAVVLRDLDVSRNRNFSTAFISKLLDLLTTYNVAVQRIRFYGSKKFDDAAIKILAKYLAGLEKSRVPFELHLSDCAITATGFAALLKSVTTNAAFPYQEPSSGRLRPLYLRVENNYIGKDTIKEWLASPKVHAISKTGNLRRRQEQPTAKTRVQLLVLPDGVCPQKSGNPPRTQETSAAGEASAGSKKGKSDEKKVAEKTPKYKEKKPAEAQEKVEEAQPAKATKSQGKEKRTAAEEIPEEKPAKGKGKGKQAVEAPETKPEEQPVKGKAKSKAKAVPVGGVPDKAPEPAPKAKATSKAAAKAEAKAAAKAEAKAEAEAKAAAKAAAKATAKATAKAAAKEKAGKKEKDSGKDQSGNEAAKAKAAAEDKKKGKKKGEAVEPDQHDLPEEKPVKGKGKGKAKVEEVPEEKAAEGKGRGKGKAEKGKAKAEEKPKWRRTSAGVDTGDACQQPSTAIATDRRVAAETTTAPGERTAKEPSAAPVDVPPPRSEKKEKSESLSAEAEAEAGTGEATSLPPGPTEAEAGTGEAGTAAEEAALTSGAASPEEDTQPAGADCKGHAAELDAGAASAGAGDVREAPGDEEAAASCAGPTTATVGAALGPESSKQGGEDVDHSTPVVGTEVVDTEEDSKSLSVACVLSRVDGLKAAAAAGLASKNCNANASSSCAASSMEEPLESSSVTSQVPGESSSTTASRQGMSATALISRVDHLRAAVAWFKSLRPPGQALHLKEALRLIDDCPAVEKGCAEVWGEWYSLLARSTDPMKSARRIISMAEALWQQGYLGPTREAKPAERARPQRSKSREEELLRDLPLSSVCKSGSIKPGETGWVHTYRL